MPQLADRLKAVQTQKESVRASRAAAIKERDEFRAKLEQGADIKRDDPAFISARDAARKASSLGDDLTELSTEESEILVMLGRGDEASGGTGGNGPEDGRRAVAGEIADPEAVKALTTTPGLLLASMLEGRKAEVSTLPADVRRKPPTGAMAAAMNAPLTTVEVDTVTESAALIDLLAPQSVALASGIPRLNIDTTKTRVPRFTDLPVAGWIPELGAFPKNGPGLEMVDVKPPKAGLITELSIEVFEDLRPLTLAMLQVQLLRAVALAYDRGILFGAPDPADPDDVRPRGVANTTGIQVVSGVPLTNLGAFARAIARLIAANARPGALYMNPIDIGTLLELTESSDGAGSNVPLWKASVGSPSGLRLPYFDTPIWPTPAAPQGKALLSDPQTILAVIRHPADIAIDPYYGFDNGVVGLRTYVRGDVVVGQPDGSVRIEFAPPGP
jgi:HK97 family phage major capsid protein